MIKSYEKFRLVDEGKRNEFYLEVNWNEKDPKSNECKLIKVTFPNGETCIIRRDILVSVLFAFGTEEQQQKMIPQKISQVRFLKTTLGIKATRDIHKGEMINIPVDLKLPSIEEEVIGSIREFAQKKAQFRS